MGRKRFAVLCKILLIVFQRARVLDEEKWTGEEYNDLLVVNINLW